VVHAFRDADAARSGPVAGGHTECLRDNDAPTRARAAVVTAAEPYRNAAHAASRAEVAKGTNAAALRRPSMRVARHCRRYVVALSCLSRRIFQVPCISGAS